MSILKSLIVWWLSGFIVIKSAKLTSRSTNAKQLATIAVFWASKTQDSDYSFTWPILGKKRLEAAEWGGVKIDQRSFVDDLCRNDRRRILRIRDRDSNVTDSARTMKSAWISSIFRWTIKNSHDNRNYFRRVTSEARRAFVDKIEDSLLKLKHIT